VRTHRACLTLLLAACAPEPGATTDTEDTASSTSDAASAVTTGSADPGTDASGDSTGAAPTTTAGDTDTGGDTPPADCPVTVPPPVDCGPVPELCGNGTPIAGGPAFFVSGAALTRDHVWFQLSTTGCPVSLYRAPTSGGDAHWVRPAADMIDYEADDDALYLVERTDDPFTLRVHAWVDGVETVLGETHGDPRFNSYFTTFLARTFAGVVTYDSGGAEQPPFAHLTPTALTVVAFEVHDESLGSEPEYDGERIFHTVSDPTFDDEEGHVSVHGQLVGVTGETATVLAEGATARQWPSLAADADHIYFTTGDPSELAMGLARVARTGGPVTPLLSTADIVIDKVLVDDTHVYFHEATEGFFAVEKAGGTPRHLWFGKYGIANTQIQQDADNLYFSVGAPGGDIPSPGREFVVRVAKSAEIP
jgi:hypothetical protein